MVRAGWARIGVDADDRRTVKDRCTLPRSVGDRGGVENIGFDGACPRQHGVAQTFAAQAMIEGDHVVAAREQRIDQMAADKSGGAGDQGFHTLPFI